MIKNIVNFLEATVDAVETTAATTTSNVFLDENGQFEDVSQVADNISAWWQEMDIIGTVMTKLPTVILAAVLIILGIFISRIISKLAAKAMHARGVDPSVYNFIRRIISVLIKAVFFLSALSMFININSIIAAIGAAGVTAGLGLQASVAQFASGIQLLVNRPFKSGDFVEINGVAGSVVDVRFMQTVINTPDNKRIIIPNSHITTNHIINYTAENKRRVDLNFSISYSDDISHAKRIIAEVANNNGLILKDPAVQVFVNGHEASCISLVTRVWCKGEHYWDVFFAMQEEVKIAFDKNGVCIPFNQLDVHIVNEK
jgi:small conductance mechanosensitive channel